MEKSRIKANLMDRLALRGPLIQAPMAGGATTPELVAAVSNAGALGSLGGGYLAPAELENAIRQTRSFTNRPFAVNLFIPAPEPTVKQDQIDAAILATRVYRRELGIREPVVQPPFSQNFAEQFAVILREQPAVFSFTFGLLEQSLLEECRNRDIMTFGTATTLEEAMALEASGVDAVVAQGAEAGAHRATFHSQKEDLLFGLGSLMPILASKLSLPIIAAGGIMNGRGIAASLALGAQAAQLGTAFLACDESGIANAYRDALLDPNRRVTRLTRAFSGRWARGLENRFMMEMGSKENAILPYPAQNAFTQDIRKAAALGHSDYLALWAGQGVGLIRATKAEMLVQSLFDETSDAIRVLQSLSAIAPR